MTFFSKLLALLWLINFAPPLVAQVFSRKWTRPVDCGHTFTDGRPLFGSHKTVRGLLAGIGAGVFTSVALGFPWWIGLGTGVLSMSGDIFSSFMKRRLSFLSGDVVPGLDQVPEGAFPFLLLAPYFHLSFGFVLVFLAVFSTGAYFGSVFLNEVLLEKPYESYPRRVRPTTRIREILSCQITHRHLHKILNFEDAFYYHFFMKSVFQVLGIYGRGKRNALVIEPREVVFDFPNLPAAFDGYRILFLADLHLDGLESLTEKVVEIVRQIPVDLCVLGGDFRMETHGPFAEALSRLSRVIPEIRAKDGILGVLGNHDCIEIVEVLNETGINFLINDSAPIERAGERIWFVGVDDSHYYKCQDVGAAFGNVPKGAFTVFISHSNEVYRQAREFSPDIFLCGHTHGGQIRLPRIGPVFTHSKAPRYMCMGQWFYGGMLGYTSAGVGVSGVPVRFNSTGEVTVITLRRKGIASSELRVSG